MASILVAGSSTVGGVGSGVGRHDDELLAFGMTAERISTAASRAEAGELLTQAEIRELDAMATTLDNVADMLEFVATSGKRGTGPRHLVSAGVALQAIGGETSPPLENAAARKALKRLARQLRDLSSTGRSTAAADIARLFRGVVDLVAARVSSPGDQLVGG